MFRSASVFAIAILFGLVGVKSTYADTTDEEVVFTQINRVNESYSDCTNNGNIYGFSITGLVNGAEKTIAVAFIDPTSSGDSAKARNRMIDFCEKAALLTKSQPDKYDLYVKIQGQGGASGGPGTGACQGSSGGSSTLTTLICELR